MVFGAAGHAEARPVRPRGVKHTTYGSPYRLPSLSQWNPARPVACSTPCAHPNRTFGCSFMNLRTSLLKTPSTEASVNALKTRVPVLASQVVPDTEAPA